MVGRHKQQTSTTMFQKHQKMVLEIKQETTILVERFRNFTDSCKRKARIIYLLGYR